MKKLFIILLLILVPLVSAASLSNYPDLLDYDDLYIVTNRKQTVDHSMAATNILFSLSKRKKVNNVFDDEVTSFNHDFILFGKPSQNIVVKHFFSDLSLSGNEALIKYLEVDGNNVIVLAAANDEDLIKLSEYVKNNGKMSGTEYRIGEEVVKAESACMVDGESLSLGEVSSLNGKPVYCSKTGLKNQLMEGSTCSENYECFNNDCLDGSCGSKGFFSKIWDWIVSLF